MAVEVEVEVMTLLVKMSRPLIGSRLGILKREEANDGRMYQCYVSKREVYLPRYFLSVTWAKNCDGTGK